MHFTVPDKYRAATLPELAAIVADAKRRYGRKMLILAHHYQRLEVTEAADFIGDSYELSRVASERKDAEHIVFCGVHFMAESADILSADYQKVYLPNPLAGCPMADMADIDDVLAAWQRLVDLGLAERTLPLSYMNSAAELKAFCGRQGGLICTSSNARAAYEYIYARADKLFFFPDENLGYNVGRQMGISDDRIVVWDFRTDDGGIDPDRLRNARLILWKGHCHVHTNFRPEHVEEVRRRFPNVKVVVHPECVWDVVVGTEINLINRMAHAHPDKRIFELSGQTCPVCANMYRTTMADLANTVENLDVFDRIVVREEIKADARLALNRMLEVH
jgi:quinolinate synthase